MTSNKNELKNFVSFENPLHIKLADNSTLCSYGKGDVTVSIYNNGSDKMDILLTDVLLVPKIKNKLLSLSAVIQKGAEVHFCNDKCTFTINTKNYDVGHKHGKLYKLNIYPLESCCYGSRTASVVDSVSIWHKRYGHLGYDNLNLLSDKIKVTAHRYEVWYVFSSSW